MWWLLSSLSVQADPIPYGEETFSGCTVAHLSEVTVTARACGST